MGSERRKLERHRALEGIFVTFENETAEIFGILDDISHGGCGFVYGGPSRQTAELMTVTIFPSDFSREGLEKISGRIIHDTKLHSPTAQSILRRCGMAFESMEEEQERDLEFLLKSRAFESAPLAAVK